MTNIKLNFKKVMLLVLALTACSSQAGWSDWGRVFSFTQNSKAGIALQTYQPKVAIAAVATCVTVCALAALAWNKYRSWGVSQIVQPVPDDTEKRDLSDHVVSLLTNPVETENKPAETNTNLNLPSFAEGVVVCGADNDSIYSDFTQIDAEYEGADSMSKCMRKPFKSYEKSLLGVSGKQTIFTNQDDPADMIIFYHDINGNIYQTYYMMKNPSIRVIIKGSILGVDNIHQIKIIRFFNQEYKIFVNDTLALTFEVKKD